MVIDDLLRACEFKIHTRKANTEPIWVKDGKKYLERRALEIACGIVDEAAKEKYGEVFRRSRAEHTRA